MTILRTGSFRTKEQVVYLLFAAFAFCIVLTAPLHFLSVEHLRLQEQYGKNKGKLIGERYGRISGYLLLLSLIGLWFSPQPRFHLPIFQSVSVVIPMIRFRVPLAHLIVFLPAAGVGTWLLVQSVTGLTRRVSEAHRPEKVVTEGIYAKVRHPQYLGFTLMQIGFAFLVSGWYALLSTPLVVLMLWLFARKEEKELVKEFGADYEEYRGRVPMLVPKLRE
jgi:protein-S-isoprenylcysteine O-methyltransferase Ste14